jgi:hypothetical protein
MVEAWQNGFGVLLMLCAAGLLVSLIFYICVAFTSGSSKRDRRTLARFVLFFLIGGPVLASVWPLTLVLAVIVGGYKLVVDAWPS